MAAISVMGAGGAPMRAPFGSFAGKTPAPVSRHFTVMGPMGAPMRPPYGSFAGKPSPPTHISFEWLIRARRRGRR
jgi:hypothetical protein